MTLGSRRIIGIVMVSVLAIAAASTGHAQRSILFPDWFLASDAPTWEIETRQLSPIEENYLVVTARRNLEHGCKDFEAFRWNLVEPDQFLGPPIADFEFYSLLEEQNEGVEWVDVNLSTTYGVSRDGRFAFVWDAPWGLWPSSGIYVDFAACRTGE